MSVCQADPWQVKESSIKQLNIANTETIEKFEDNFIPNKLEDNKTADNEQTNVEPLPDSANYLQLLERKLQKVQKGSKLLDSLQQKKQDCMRSLLDSGVPERKLEELLEFDTPIENGRLHRHLLPVQAVTVGETLEIVKYDALEELALADEEKLKNECERKNPNNKD